MSSPPNRIEVLRFIHLATGSVITGDFLHNYDIRLPAHFCALASCAEVCKHERPLLTKCAWLQPSARPLQVTSLPLYPQHEGDPCHKTEHATDTLILDGPQRCSVSACVIDCCR